MAEYVLYVIELRDAVARRRDVPDKRSGKPYVYVGYTSKSRPVRLREHRRGRFAGDRKWAPHYARARPDLYRVWPTYRTQAEALAGERGLAATLVRRGYTVVNAVGDAIRITRSG